MELDAVKPLRRDHNYFNILQQTFIGSPDNHRAPLNGLGFRNLRRSKTLITLESDDRTELLRDDSTCQNPQPLLKLPVICVIFMNTLLVT